MQEGMAMMGRMHGGAGMGMDSDKGAMGAPGASRGGPETRSMNHPVSTIHRAQR